MEGYDVVEELLCELGYNVNRGNWPYVSYFMINHILCNFEFNNDSDPRLRSTFVLTFTDVSSKRLACRREFDYGNDGSVEFNLTKPNSIKLIRAELFERRLRSDPNIQVAISFGPPSFAVI